jgi:ABC-type amino acid transport substrate-binding protein
MDWSSVTVAGIDGEGATTTVMKLHPEAKIVALPPASQIPEMLNMVVGKKADMGFVLPTVYKSFNDNNPGVLKRIESKEPLSVFSVGFAIKPEEQGLKNMLDIVIRQMIVSGELEKLVNKYDPDGLFIKAER